MDRDLFRSFPAGDEEAGRLLARLAALPPEERSVTAVSPDGTERRLLVELSVSVEEPFGGEATVVVRLRFSGEAPGEDETVRENLWETAAAFLAEAQARSAAAAPDAAG
ncbi:MAG: hypothetical protein DYH06_15985 [Acidobacteria bacterium ACB2]|nr:hypothetical protein [Acidobacteria bacterium ACB2]